MSKTLTNYLTYHDLHRQFWDNGIGLLDLCMSKEPLKKVAIRTEAGDYELAAIHREGEVLIFDLGHKVEEP